MLLRIFKGLRLFPIRREESFFLLQELLGFKPGNQELYKLALLHKSSSKKDKQGNILNNERLEFLGDAILDAIIAEMLYDQFPDKKEGFLTNVRSKIVNRVNLNKIALKIGLDKVLVSTTNNSTTNIYGNAFEALIGAVYLDVGFDKCKIFIEDRVFNGILDLETLTKKEINFKSRLLEWSQKNRRSLEFELVEETMGERNIPAFISQVKIDGVLYGSGSGKSKKESHQDAARQTLKLLKERKAF